VPFFAVGEEGGIVFDFQFHFAADKVEVSIAHECSGQETCFGDDLKAIADTQNLESFQGFGANVCHDGRARRDGPAAEIIPIGKAAGNDNEINFRKFRIRMPDSNGSDAGDRLKGNHHVPFAIDAREYDDRRFHVWGPKISVIPAKAGIHFLV